MYLIFLKNFGSGREVSKKIEVKKYVLKLSRYFNENKIMRSVVSQTVRVKSRISYAMLSACVNELITCNEVIICNEVWMESLHEEVKESVAECPSRLSNTCPLYVEGDVPEIA